MPYRKIEDPVVSEAIRGLIVANEKQTIKIESLESRFDDFDRANIHNNYKLKEMIVDAVATGMKPVIDASNKMEKRIVQLEDRPKDTSYKILTWAVGGMGAIIIALLTALLKTLFKI